MYPSAGGKKHWLLVLDEATDYAHSIYLKKTSDMVGVMLLWIKQKLGMKYYIYIKKIKLGNSGENKMLQAKLIKKTWESRLNSQENSVVERKCTTRKFSG